MIPNILPSIGAKQRNFDLGNLLSESGNLELSGTAPDWNSEEDSVLAVAYIDR